MGGLFQMLTLGTSALQVQQRILQTTGNNVANASTPGYSRQQADVVNLFPTRLGNLIVGNGARVADITRVRDIFLQQQIVREAGVLADLNVRRDFITQVEDILNEPGDLGISAALGTFFNSIQDLATNPEQSSVRVQLRDTALALADTLSSTFEALDRLRTNLNDRVEDSVLQINELVGEVADLNKAIINLEAGGPSANDLKDRRDQLVRQIADLIDANITFNDNGTINVFLDGYALVQEFTSNELGTRTDLTIDPNRPDLFVVFGVQDNRVLEVNSGTIGGLLALRDDLLTRNVLGSLNTLAAGLTEHINRVHLQGIGLDRFTDETSAYGVDDPTLTLDSVTGLPFSMQAGAFFITVYDGTGAFVEQREITVDPTVDTLNDVAARINAEFPSGNIVATVDINNRLQIQTTGLGQTFTFISDDTAAADTSDFLLAMGFNQFFTFDPAADAAVTLDVAQDIQDNVARIAAARTTSVGDNQNAIALADLRGQLLLSTTGAPTTLEEFFEGTVVQVGIASADIQIRQLSQASFVLTIENRIESVSGVNIDEETVSLIEAQTAFAAAARFIATVSNVLEILTTEVA